MGLSIALIVSISKLCIPAHGFLHLMNVPAPRSVHKLTAKEEDSNYQHRWNHEPFDFSSKFGWDKFYKNGLNHTDTVEAPEFGDCDTIESLEYEWHPHISHSIIVDAIEPTISAASQYYSRTMQPTASQHHLPSILLVGCGNSALPRILHDSFDTPVRVTCLDYSPVCIEMIKSMYESSCPNMDFVVGDATKLQEVMWEEDAEKAKSMHFDIILDKGLLDALNCDEGFDLDRLMEGVNDVLTPHDWGLHVLICFQLSRSDKESLVELGDKNGSGLVWDFDIPVEGSENGRGCFNLGRRRQDTNVLGIDQITAATEW
eukprot:CAMPEP_0172307874 /NCGR_PEP_ID=MMETSP1058-20130122/8637_1 /TAXON_ID=83371 /ORGANISM="Detonula confervacea, Strain CCMP 353" /LENGTH=315 /DNA_ID=CAMNT_0013020167 /DNA_START=120 /DNA_END=1064 /DNA_ORIENTATION=+